MNNKILLTVFVALCAVYFLTKTFRGNKQQSFKTELIALDTASITTFQIASQADDYQPFTLSKSGNTWTINQAGNSYPASPSSVTTFLSNLVAVKTLRVVAKGADKYKDYEVGEETAKSKIKVYNGKDLLADFVVGGFRFDQQKRSATSFLKLAEGPEVYAVDGFMAMSMAGGYDSYRDKTFLKIAKEDISGFSINGPGFDYAVNKMSGTWASNTDTPIDSTKVEGFLNSLGNMSGTQILNNYTPNPTEKIAEIQISRNNNPSIQVDCYANSSGSPFALHSSLNNSVYFASDSTGIFSKIFKSIDFFQ